MGQKPLHNVVIAITPPDERPQTIISLTVPEPGALRLAEGIAGAQHTVFPSEIARMIGDGFRQLDEITVNPPVPLPDYDNPPKGEPLVQVYEAELEAVYEGRAHLYRDIETGKIEIRDGDGKATDIDALTGTADDQKGFGLATDPKAWEPAPLASGSAFPDLGADQGGPISADIPSSDGSISGEKHSEENPAGT